MKNVLAALTLSFATLSAFAIDVKVSRVHDRRSGGNFSTLTIGLELPKVKSSDVTASRVFVTAATDDTGRNLFDRESTGEPGLEPNHRFGNEKPDTPASVALYLMTPARNATKVTELRGEIELFMPSKDPNTIAEIPKFMSFSGKALNHKALKANGVEIALVSPAQIEAEKKRLGAAKRKEYTELGYEGEGLDQMVNGYLEYVLRTEPSDIVFRLKDPNNRIQEIAWINAAGETNTGSMRDDEGFKILSTWGAEPQPDWKLRVTMRTPKNLVRHAFVVKDVALP